MVTKNNYLEIWTENSLISFALLNNKPRYVFIKKRNMQRIINIIKILCFFVCTHIYDPLLKMHIKWSDLCNALVSTWVLMLPSTFTRVRAGRKWSNVAIFGRFKRVQKRLRLIVGEKNHFPPPTSLSRARCCESPTTLSLLQEPDQDENRVILRYFGS